MKKNNIPKVFGIIIALGGVVIMANWFLGIGVLKSILPDCATMKGSTTLSFILSGISVYFIARFREGSREMSGIIITMTSLVTLIFMVTLCASFVIQTDVGVEELFMDNLSSESRGLLFSFPAVPTMINFILIAMAGLFTVLDIKVLRHTPAVVGVLVGVVGAVAVVGYIIDQPLLYYLIPGVSGAMAAYTAVFFVLMGIGMMSMGGDK